MPDTIRKPFPITSATAGSGDNAFGDDEDTVLIQKKNLEAKKAEPAPAGKGKAKNKKG